MALKLASTYKLIDLLARLRAAHQFYWTAHWQTNGPTFAGDHAMFDEFYNGVVPEIDTLAEKLVALSGTEVVDPNTQVAAQAVILKMWTGLPGGLFEKAVAVEASIQDGIDDVMEAMGPSGEMSHGLSNFLEGVADAHEKNSYKLKQRLSPATKVAAAAGTDTASLVVIDPAMLQRVADKIIAGMTIDDIETLARQHGAAVIHTGGDGVFHVTNTANQGGSELDYLPPYGTPDFGKTAAQRVAARHMAAVKLPRPKPGKSPGEPFYLWSPAQIDAFHLAMENPGKRFEVKHPSTPVGAKIEAYTYKFRRMQRYTFEPTAERGEMVTLNEHGEVTSRN